MSHKHPQCGLWVAQKLGMISTQNLEFFNSTSQLWGNARDENWNQIVRTCPVASTPAYRAASPWGPSSQAFDELGLWPSPGRDCHVSIFVPWLVVEPYPSEKWWSWSVGMIFHSQYMKSQKNKKCSKPPTSYICVLFLLLHPSLPFLLLVFVGRLKWKLPPRRCRVNSCRLLGC